MGSRSSSSTDPGGGGCGSYDVTPSNSVTSTSSWYVDKSIEINECEINVLEDVFEEVTNLDVKFNGDDYVDEQQQQQQEQQQQQQTANVIEFKRPCSTYFDDAIDQCKYLDLEPIASNNECEPPVPEIVKEQNPVGIEVSLK